MFSMMKNNLIAIGVIQKFSKALTWAGLPAFTYQITGSYEYATILYFANALAHVLSNWLSGVVADRKPAHTILKVSIFLNALTYLFFYFVIIPPSFPVLFTFMLVSQILGTMISMNYILWLNSLAESDQLAREISKRNSWFAAAKTTGLILGPLTYAFFSYHAILFNVFSMILSFFLLRYVPQKEVVKTNEKKKSIWGVLKEIKEKESLRIYAIVEFLSGLIFPVISNFALYILKTTFEMRSDYFLSFFWGLVGITSVLANVVLAKWKVIYFPISKLHLWAAFLLGSGALLITSLTSVTAFVIGFVLFTAGKPIFMNLLGSKIYLNSSNTAKGTTMAAFSIFTETASLISVSYSHKLAHQFGPRAFMIPVLIFMVLQINLFFFHERKIAKKKLEN